MQRRALLAVAVAMIITVFGCSQHEPITGAKPSLQPAATTTQATPSLSEIRQMLGKQLTVAQVKQRLGKPVSESEQPWGNLMYPLPDNKWLFFFFKGPYVTGARYDKTDIAGIPAPTHELLVRSEMIGGKRNWHLELDGRIFANLVELKKHVQSLPKGALVEYQASCVRLAESQPLTAQQDIDVLRQLCQEAGVILLFYPAG